MGNRMRINRSGLGRAVTPDSMRYARAALAVGVASCVLAAGGEARAQSLVGSSASLDRQESQAEANGFSYLETPARVRAFVDAGYLVPVRPTKDFELHDVSFPFARPEVRLFVERLAPQYRSACGEKLVVTSMTRPLSDQPWNASDRSVHPTGMAVDLRRSGSSRCRSWLESTLLSLEGTGVLEATREKNPAHYHVAVFPRAYAAYVAARTDGGATVAARSQESATVTFAQRTQPAASEQAAPAAEGSASSTSIQHTVSRGESLWTIAREYGVDQVSIRRANRLAGDRILVGQKLSIPRAGAASSEPLLHKVGRGQSLWSIARAYGVTEDAIRALNGISGSRIIVGDVLRIPAPEGGETVLRYTVERGDSLSEIADAHGTTVEELRRTNGLRTTKIYAGQVLSVPLTF